VSNGRLPQREEPLRDWLPMVVLKSLVLLAFAFVLLETTVGAGRARSGLWAGMGYGRGHDGVAAIARDRSSDFSPVHYQWGGSHTG